VGGSSKTMQKKKGKEALLFMQVIIAAEQMIVKEVQADDFANALIILFLTPSAHG